MFTIYQLVQNFTAIHSIMAICMEYEWKMLIEWHLMGIFMEYEWKID